MYYIFQYMFVPEKKKNEKNLMALKCKHQPLKTYIEISERW